MKVLFNSFIFLVLCTTYTLGQSSLKGLWEGGITVPGSQLKIVFKIDEASQGYSGTLDIPQQSANGIKLDPITQSGDSVFMKFSIGQVTGTFNGVFESEKKISGTYSQGGPSTPFSVEKISDSPTPEQPKNETELIIPNGDLQIGGTLTLPDGDIKAPLVIMSSGSGAQDRNSEIFGFKIFSIIAQHLAEKGIPSFRYDDRGIGKSSGNFSTTTVTDLASDVTAIMSYFQNDSEHTFTSFSLLGHSQGGVVAGKVAAENSESVSQLILMASTAPPISEILRYQVEFAYSTSAADQELVQKEIDAREALMEAIVSNENLEEAKSRYHETYTNVLNSLPEAQRNSIPNIDAMVSNQTEQLVQIYSAPQTKSLLFYSPVQDLENISASTLVLYGGKDTQVTISQNREKTEIALEKSDAKFQVKVFDEANHLFQKANTGLASEYPTLEPSFISGFLDYLADWIVSN